MLFLLIVIPIGFNLILTPKLLIMRNEVLMENSSSHFGNEPMFKKVLKVAENGDVNEVYEPLSKDDKLKGAVGCSMADLGDGFMVPDVSFLDKFQAMDLLENYVDNMDISGLTPKNDENE